MQYAGGPSVSSVCRKRRYPGPALVVDDIPGHYDGIGRPAAIVTGIGKYSLQGRLGIDASMRPVHGGKEMRIGDLQQHDGPPVRPIR